MVLNSPDLKKAMTGSRASRRRKSQRDRLWADAEEVVFPTKLGGWAQIPRTAPMIGTLIDQIRKKESAGRLYLVLWSYEFGDGFVEVPDPAMVALEAGYTMSRAERSFNERMRVLCELGFIRTAPLGVREFGYVLLVNPHPVVARLRAHARFPDGWWSTFQARCAMAGIELPEASAVPTTSSG